MTTNQIRWARTHDWFVSAQQGTVTACAVGVWPDGRIDATLITFQTFAALYAWAGY